MAIQAAATEKEASAGEEGRQVAKENDQYHADLLKQMKSCSTNYVNFETEMCGVKKIRGQLYIKLTGASGKPFFQDCKLSDWTKGECSAECAGGEQTGGTRQHRNGAGSCLYGSVAA